MFNNKKVLKLEKEVTQLKHEIDTNNDLKIDLDKLYIASDEELKVLYKYFGFASRVGTLISKERLNRLKLRELGIELGIDEPKNIIGTLKQNEDFITELIKKNHELGKQLHDLKEKTNDL